jgi:hypothetical protein
MTEREGEGRKDEVSEDPEEALEHYRKELDEKYGEEDGGNKDEPGDTSGEGDVKEEKEPADDSGSGDSAKSESGVEKVDNATERQVGDSSQTGPQHGQEPKEEPPSDEKTSGGYELESMREYLNEKYPGDEKDAPEGEETQPATPSAGENEGGVDPPEVNPTESSKQEISGANQASTADQTETTAANNAAERPEHDLSGREDDVGWETLDGHATQDKPQGPPKSDEIQPKEFGATQEDIGSRDSRQPQNEFKEEVAKSAETPQTGETQVGKVEPAKTDADDLSFGDKPLADGAQMAGGSQDNPVQVQGEKQVADNEKTKTTDLHGSAQQSRGSAERESVSESTSNSDRQPGQEIKESQAKDAPEGAEQTRTKLDRLDSQSRDAKAEQGPLVDATAHYMSNNGKIRLDVEKAALEEAVGQSLRDGDMYRIAGRVEGTPSHFEARLSGTRSDYAYVFLDGNAEGVVPSQSYQLRIEQFEKDRTFEVSQGSKGPYIRVYETVLESLGVTRDGSDGVVQFQVRNGREGEVRQVYANYNSATGWMQISVGEIGARNGDGVEITGASRYRLEDAVADFNRYKPESLKNVSMALEKERLFLGVDGQRFEAKEPRLTSHGGKAVLKMGIAKDDLKFQLDGKTATARFENSERIREFKTIGGGLYATRERSKNESHLRQIVPEKAGLMSYGEMREWAMNKIKVVSGGDKIEGMHRLEATREFQETVRRRLTYAGTRHTQEKGDVGEILACKLFQSIGLEIVKDHPTSQGDESRGSSRNGPESVVRSAQNGALYYTEVKNQLEMEKARRDAIGQSKFYLAMSPEYNGESIRGAFIAITNWSGETSMVEFHVEAVNRNVRS